jgi:hypothetical protein
VRSAPQSPAPAVTIDSQRVAADLARHHLGLDLDDLEGRVVTRSLYHRHSSWRRSTRLHWSATCQQMSGRSEVTVRTVEFSTTDTDALAGVCSACRPRRTRDLSDVVGAASLIELLDTYLAPDDRYHPHAGDPDDGRSRQLAAASRRHARRITHLHPAAHPIGDAVDTRTPLPISRELLDTITATTWAARDSVPARRLEQLGASPLLTLLTRSLGDQQLTAGGRRRSWCAAAARTLWPNVTAAHLSHLNPAAPSEHPAGTPQGQDPYRQLQEQWVEQVTAAAVAWLDGRDQLLRRTGRSTPTLLASTLDLNDRDNVTGATPTGLAVVTDHHTLPRAPTGRAAGATGPHASMNSDAIRLYSTSAAAAELYRELLGDDTVIVGIDDLHGRELGHLTLQLAAQDHGLTLTDAAAAAAAAWTPRP